MQRHDTPHIPSTLQISVDEGVHAADLAERILPGGAGLVQGLVRAQREALRGLSALIDANVHELDKLDESIGDAARPRWNGSIGRGLLLAVAKRASAIHAAISQAEAAVLHKLTTTLMREPDHESHHGSNHGSNHGPSRRSEKVKIE